jgi:ABC-type methionine transport system ATPase subunit
MAKDAALAADAVSGFRRHRMPLSCRSMADQTRLWLMYPARLITRPVIYELGQKFRIITNVRQASVTDEIGLVSLELEGERSDIHAAIHWLEELGVKVEPVEIQTIEG